MKSAGVSYVHKMILHDTTRGEQLGATWHHLLFLEGTFLSQATHFWHVLLICRALLCVNLTSEQIWRGFRCGFERDFRISSPNKTALIALPVSGCVDIPFMSFLLWYGFLPGPAKYNWAESRTHASGWHRVIAEGWCGEAQRRGESDRTNTNLHSTTLPPQPHQARRGTTAYNWRFYM